MNLNKDLIFYILSFMIPGNLNSTEKVSEAIVQKIQRKQDINDNIKKIFNGLEKINQFFQENKIKQTDDFKYIKKDLIEKFNSILKNIDINIFKLDKYNISIDEAKEILNNNISHSDNNQKFIFIFNSFNDKFIECTLKPKLDQKSNIKFYLKNFEDFKGEIGYKIKENLYTKDKDLSGSDKFINNIKITINKIKSLFENRSFPGFDQMNEDSLLKLNELVNHLNSSLIDFYKYQECSYIENLIAHDLTGLEKLLKIKYNEETKSASLINFEDITQQIEEKFFSKILTLETTEDTGLGGVRDTNDEKKRSQNSL